METGASSIQAAPVHFFMIAESSFVAESLIQILPNSDNIFNSLPELSEVDNSVFDELKDYLGLKTETVTDLCAWWYERRSTYPCLSQMALNYHTIPGECLFFYIVS